MHRLCFWIQLRKNQLFPETDKVLPEHWRSEFFRTCRQDRWEWLFQRQKRKCICLGFGNGRKWTDWKETSAERFLQSSSERILIWKTEQVGEKDIHFWSCTWEDKKMMTGLLLLSVILSALFFGEFRLKPFLELCSALSVFFVLLFGYFKYRFRNRESTVFFLNSAAILSYSCYNGILFLHETEIPRLTLYLKVYFIITLVFYQINQ